MRTRTLVVTLIAVFALAAAVAAIAAPNAPHIGYAYPPGAQAGTNVDVLVGGQFLRPTRFAVFSAPGITADIGDYYRPLTGVEASDLRDKMQAARDKLRAEVGPNGRPLRFTQDDVVKEAGLTPTDIANLEKFRQRNDPKRQLNPQLAETVTLHVHVDQSTPPGIYELRIIAPTGISNPLRFAVGSAPEVVETTPRASSDPMAVSQPPPFVIDGQILPGAVDTYTFHAAKGERVQVSVAARELMPYLADAVPGWFQAAVSVTDPAGREIAYADTGPIDPDPSVTVLAPADGEYGIAIHDALYRGREDFVYRVSVADATSDAQPPAAGAIDDTQLTGLPVVAEIKPNDSGARAQAVTLPVVVTGCVDKPGDRDVYAFQGTAGETVVAETIARRTGSPLDSTLSLIDGNGKLVAFNDDTPDPGAGMVTDQADSYISAKLPATGKYYVVVADALRHGGPDYVYRLRLSAPIPDFELRLMPSGIFVRNGSTASLTISVIRRDGFSGPVAFALQNAPRGCTLTGGPAVSTTDPTTLTLHVGNAPIGEYNPQVVGTATIGGVAVTREATPADNMMQAFAYYHMVTAQQWCVAIFPRLSPAVAAALAQGAAQRPGATKPVSTPAAPAPPKPQTPVVAAK